MEHDGIQNYSDPGPEFNIKSQELSVLKERLLEVAGEWPEEDARRMQDALRLAEVLHADDRHKDLPYVYHVVRVAVRIALYLEVKDPDILCAALLHDSVEDHPEEIIKLNRVFTAEEAAAMSQRERQLEALVVLNERFNPRVAGTVAAVTNQPEADRPNSYEAKIDTYAAKVGSAVTTSEGWLVKFGDWCDNGVGVIHDVEGQGDKHCHFQRKYGRVLPILEARFYEEDIQQLVSVRAKAYVQRQFARGRERLTVAEPLN